MLHCIRHGKIKSPVQWLIFFHARKLNLADKANTFKILGVRILKHDKIQVVVINDSLDDVTADGPRILSLSL